MRLYNTESQYGWPVIVFHWLMAALVIGLIVVGLYMTRLPISAAKLKFYGWHKEFGITVLILVMLRFGWRMINVTPLLPDTLPLWQKFGAHAVHWALYFFMIAMPITGWLLTSASGLAPSFFGLFVLPTLIAPHDEWRHTLALIHTWLGYGLIATIAAHVGAALKHHFINKDDIFRRMLS
jgi:cytochrome b561